MAAILALATVPPRPPICRRVPIRKRRPIRRGRLIYDWTGFYIGGHLGGAFGGDSNIQGTGGRFLGGVQGGVDFQFAPNWVVGAEAQYSWLGGNNNAALFPGGNLVTTKNDQARLGATGRPRLHLGSGLASTPRAVAMPGRMATTVSP